MLALARRVRPALSRLFGRWLDLGTSGYGRVERRQLRVMNALAALIAVSSLLYALSYAATDSRTYSSIVAINLALTAVAICVPLLHRLHPAAGGLLVLAAECPALIALTGLLGRDSGIQLNMVIGAAAAFFIFGAARPLLGLFGVASFFVSHLVAWFMYPVAALPMPGGFVTQLYVSSAANVFIMIAALTYYSFRLTERAEAATEALLHNILPATIVARLREHPEQSIAEAFDSASILFSDIQGFVPLSQRLGAARTVAMLNELMRRFDALAARYQVEKIKTIGDAYMAVAGVPEPVPDHADRLVRMGLEMFDAKNEVAAQFAIPIRMRIGVASGPVMAGIIGTHKFSYDVWGDAVNLAARLESSGEAERIQVSADARAALSSELFAFESRGEVEIKGLGPLQTWFVVPRARAAAIEGAAPPS
ncbi:MAG: adenylate/guanylate cyclase domain-containing protein [Alphaproteobacteria bacterium]|nr:adenylate/guanylate cyclase domain-containing protein [Alphaproteobacteria bacterium]